MKPLSTRQKSVLCQLARRAYGRLVAKGQLSGVGFDQWRHDECERAVGRHGLTACTQNHYLPLLSHFESLAGEDGRALAALMRQQTEPQRQAEAVLLGALNQAGLPVAYAEAISQDKFRRPVLDLDAGQLWQLIYTVRNRAAARRRAAQDASPRPAASVSGPVAIGNPQS